MRSDAVPHLSLIPTERPVQAAPALQKAAPATERSSNSDDQAAFVLDLRDELRALLALFDEPPPSSPT